MCPNPKNTSINSNIGIIRATYSNMGDVAILKGALNVFEKLGIHPKFIFDPEPFFPENYFENMGITPVYTFPSKVEHKIFQSGGFNKITNYLIPLSSFSNDFFFRKKNEINYLYCIGGSRFGIEQSKYVIAEILNVLYKKKLLGSQLIIGGASVSKHSTSKYFKYLYKIFAKNVNYAFVRDDISYSNLTEYLPKNKCSVICDFAYWIHPLVTQNSVNVGKFIEVNSKGKKTIAIFPGLNLKSKEEYISNLCKLITELYNENYSIFLIPTFNHPYLKDDNDVCVTINSILKTEVNIIETKNLQPEELIYIISKFDGVVSSRLHGAIFATLANVPTVHIFSEHKGKGLFETYFKNTVCLISIEDLLKNNITKNIIEFLNTPNVSEEYSKIIAEFKEESFKTFSKKLESIEIISNY